MSDHTLDTESERSKFFDDANRLVGEISQNQTFYTVKPLLNFWAAFTPSTEVSIGGPNTPQPTLPPSSHMISSKRVIVIHVLCSERYRSGRRSKEVRDLVQVPMSAWIRG